MLFGEEEALFALLIAQQTGDPLIGSPAHEPSTGRILATLLILFSVRISRSAERDQRLLASGLSQAFCKRLDRKLLRIFPQK